MKEGTVPVSPDSSCAVRCAVITLSCVIVIGGARSGGGETPMNVRVFKNISHENQVIIRLSSELDLFYRSVTMNAAAPEGTPPRRISDIFKKTPYPAVPQRGPEAGVHRIEKRYS